MPGQNFRGFKSGEKGSQNLPKRDFRTTICQKTVSSPTQVPITRVRTSSPRPDLPTLGRPGAGPGHAAAGRPANAGVNNGACRADGVKQGYTEADSASAWEISARRGASGEDSGFTSIILAGVVSSPFLFRTKKTMTKKMISVSPVAAIREK